MNFVQRYLSPNKYPSISNSDGTISTHKMADAEFDGRYIAYPLIIQKPDGSLVELSHEDAFRHAIETGEFMEFDTQEEASAYARGGYKSRWGEKDYSDEYFQ